MGEIKQGYKQTDIGVIPEDWEISPIGEVLKINTGNKNTQDKKEDGKYPFFVRSQVVERINTYSFDGEGILTAGDGVGTGKVFHYINGKFDYHQRVYLMHGFDDKLLGKYFYWFFSKNFYERINQLTAKSSVDSVRREMIADMLIPLPQKVEQTAIAAALSDTDALIIALDKKIAKKQQIKQGAMQQLLTGKKRLPAFDGEWVEKKLIECTDINRGGSPRPIEKYITNDVNGINWIKIGDVGVNAKYIESTEEKIIPEGVSRSRYVEEGDFLLSNSMSFGRPYILKVDGCIHDGWLVIQNYQETFDTNYLYYILGFESILNQYKSLAAGSSVLNLNKQIVSNVIISCPLKSEQIAIAQILSDMDNEITQLEKERDKYKELKAGMMQVLLTGKVRLVNKNLKNEPNVIPFLSKEKAVNHNEKINEAVVISFLVNKFGSETYPLSRFRYTKFAYLLHRQVEQVAKGFKKHAAGPYKSDNRYKGPEKIAIENKYITKVENLKSGKDAFVANANIAQAMNYFNDWYGPEIQEWIGQFRFYKNDDLEVLTTVDESICDLNCKGTDISVTAIKNYIASIPQWKHKLTKSCFSDLNIERMIGKSRELFS